MSLYDPYMPEIMDDPLPIYARLRAEEPVYYIERFERHGGREQRREAFARSGQKRESICWRSDQLQHGVLSAI